MSNIDSKFIINLQGKDFITYEGLLDLAHQKGLKGIETKLIQIPDKENLNTCIVQAIAKLEDGEFYGLGDANPSNVNSFISKHLIRMAETRAKARALRDLTNVGMTAIEELGDDVEEPKTTQQATQPQPKKADEDKRVIADNSLASDKQLNFMYKLVKEKNYGDEAMKSYIKNAYGKDTSKALSKKEASEIIEMLNGLGG